MPEVQKTPREPAQEKKEKTRALIISVLSALYAISPVDIIPDVPIVGWIDDFFVVTAALLNLLEHFTGTTQLTLRSVLKALKWAVVILGIIVILLLFILGAMIVRWLT
ncbi:hypothetical protein CHU92_06625 [Flavobacterium cyanobacteriorum]|uniref:DUF1232 domain-containing protein n=1 Tax=Flavobacterium cyanobacteriorum TaxID=2022802 RepID=A0A255ZBW7_9FLAO|nr:DUF1232 domain-containing protein [Flavobacterium cyanobacteriorum]OYQ38100.1 hypothetical protein CHU92_06625 [Flavobacterium cyanobacteriorum]